MWVENSYIPSFLSGILSFAHSKQTLRTLIDRLCFTCFHVYLCPGLIAFPHKLHLLLHWLILTFIFHYCIRLNRVNPPYVECSGSRALGSPANDSYKLSVYIPKYIHACRCSSCGGIGKVACSISIKRICLNSRIP